MGRDIGRIFSLVQVQHGRHLCRNQHVEALATAPSREVADFQAAPVVLPAQHPAARRGRRFPLGQTAWTWSIGCCSARQPGILLSANSSKLLPKCNLSIGVGAHPGRKLPVQ